ncbi:MAG: GH92 family glycosyl hydrolase [Crocinitomicaceae bacterium]|nr:GH92 family glycosyl hydrolase [Crocinitomicaceae bacterium]
MKLTLTLLLSSISLICSSQVKELKIAQEKGRIQLEKSRYSNNSSATKSLYVNPFIGTGGHGHTYPGASAPFGMMQLSPDTRYEGWDGCSGYHYSDSIIYGFSHTHLSGTGIPDYADLLIVPQNGKPKTTPGYLDKNGYGDYFSHELESASPGFYSVHLNQGDIDVRLTVSERAGFHEYTFNNPEGEKSILIDLDHRDKLLSSAINILDKTTLSGHRISEDWASEQHFYFHLTLDTPYKKARAIQHKGKNKLLLIFPKETRKINIKVGMSAVDEEGAELNLESEISDWNFNKAKAKVTRSWNKELNKISFVSFDKEIMTNFYTALYHSFLAPNIFNDVDGRYRGRDKNIHTLAKGESDNYTVFSLWDTYRATHPLYTLIQVKRTNDFINTFLRQFEQDGDLPVWELAANETECMIGYHSVSVIADAYTKGIRSYDVDLARKAMIATANANEFGKVGFQTNGYINAGDEPESVSKTLEYAYDDFCIGLMEEGNESFKASNTAYNFVNAFDPSTKFMRARRSGKWFSPFNPAEVNFNYTEANSWQYSLYAPHAIGVLTDMLGGKDSLELWLDRLFTTESKLSGRHQVDITGLIGQYAHGNEPSHHMAYLYNYTNAPEKTQYYTDKILNELYSNMPNGLSGNEDCGQMSSWYVLSALGFYQIAPGNPNYEIGRPLMNEAIVQLENGKILSISVKNNSKNNKYIQSILHNGQPLKRNYIKHSELISGSHFEILMGPTPKQNRKQLPHAPTIESLPKDFVPLPFFNQTEHVFIDEIAISLDAIKNGETQLFYTLDGSEPTHKSTLYTTAIIITETTTIRAIAYNKHGKSAVITNDFIKKDQGVSLALESEYASQYAAAGEFTLIDETRGTNEYRTGDWQGYWAQDLVAEVSFDKPRQLETIGLGVLSDMKSWIFLPRKIEFLVSYDGETFESLETIKVDTPLKSDMYPHHQNFQTKTNSTQKISKIRVIANNHGKCPEWHLGNGNDTWLFADEIFFN